MKIRPLIMTTLMAVGSHSLAHASDTAIAQDTTRPIIIQAHRGFSADYPENTMLAFRKAVEAGANRIEMDLWTTSDGIPIIIHDRTVDRTTDGTGNADEMTLAQLQALDAGTWKNPSFAGTRIPTLEEALDFVKGQKGVELNLEIKTHQLPEIVQAVIADSVAMVKAKNIEDSIVFSSFSLDALLQARKLMPEARLILLYWNSDVALKGLDLARDSQLYGLSPKRPYITADLVKNATAAGIKISAGSGTKKQALEASGLLIPLG